LPTATNTENFKVMGERPRSHDRIFKFLIIAKYRKMSGDTITHKPLHSG